MAYLAELLVIMTDRHTIVRIYVLEMCIAYTDTSA